MDNAQGAYPTTKLSNVADIQRRWLSNVADIQHRCAELRPLVRILEKRGVDIKLETFGHNDGSPTLTWGIRIVARRIGTQRQFLLTVRPEHTVESLADHLQEQINEFFHR
jgi:hypothetical protein